MKKNILRVAISIAVLAIIDFSGHCILKHYCEKLYGLNQRSQILMLGHSHVAMGINADVLEKEFGCKVTKYSRAGVDIHSRCLMGYQYLNSDFSDSLKLVIFGVDPHTFTTEGLSENSHKLFYPWMDSEQYDVLIREYDSSSEYLFHKIFKLSRYNQDLYTSALKGALGSGDDNLKTNGLPTDEDYDNKKGTAICFNEPLMKDFEKTIEDISSRGINVLLVQTPVAKFVLNGQDKNYKTITGYYKSLAERNANVYYINFTEEMYSDYDLFFNPTHVNVRGQKVFTERLCEEMKKINVLQ